MVDLVDCNKLVRFDTIKRFTEDNEIDRVYVCFANEDEDRVLDCNKPTYIMHPKYIIPSNNPLVTGWRLHHHRRHEKNEKAARKLTRRCERNFEGGYYDMSVSNHHFKMFSS